MQAALDLVPAGVADAARARVLVGIASLARPRRIAGVGGRRGGPGDGTAGGNAATQSAALHVLAIIQSQSGNDTVALEMRGLARAVAGRAGAYEPLLHAVIDESHVLEGMGEHEQAANVARAGMPAPRTMVSRGPRARSWRSTWLSLVCLAGGMRPRGDRARAGAVPAQPDIRAALRQLAGDVAVRRGDLTGARETAAAARAALGTASYQNRGQYYVPLARLDIELRLAEGKPARALAAAADAVGRPDWRATPGTRGRCSPLVPGRLPRPRELPAAKTACRQSGQRTC